MKIILSEAQIIQLLKEAYGKDAYIDSLLDKMSGKGLSALSDKERMDLEKLSRGEDIEPEEPEQGGLESGVMPTDIPNHEMFMELVPQMYEFTVDNEPWHFAKEIEPDGAYEILLVSNIRRNMSFIITPFADNNVFKVTTPIRDYDFKIKTSPKTRDQMERFIEEFVKSDLKKIVKYIIDKQ